MQQSKGINVVLGVILGLIAAGVVVGGMLLFKNESKTQAPAVNTNAALQLGCSADADCVSYCGGDPCYQPICGVTSTGDAGSCTCRSVCGPIAPAADANDNENTNSPVAITNFTECAAAGYPVQESYPRKCTAGRVTFTEVSTNSNGNAASNTNQSSNTNTATRSTTLQKLRVDDRYVYYSGSITVSGTYKELEPTTLLGGQLCFYADAETGYLVPRDPNLWGEGNADTRIPWFCFKDQSAAKTLFGINDNAVFRDPAVTCIQGKATVEVSNYVVDKLESEVFDTAELGNIVAKEAYVTSCK